MNERKNFANRNYYRDIIKNLNNYKENGYKEESDIVIDRF